MKTAVSIPDEVFAEAERLAKKMKKSRSRLYADALKEYTRRHDPDAITDAINRVIEREGYDEEEEAFIREAARRVLEQPE